MPSSHDTVSEQFLRWEHRGRGWQVFLEPVTPEPPFRPFERHFIESVQDDGKRPTFLSSLFGKITEKLDGKPKEAQLEPEDEEEPEPTSLVREELIELHTALPAKLDMARDVFEHFLSNLGLCQEPIAFELVGVHNTVEVQFVAGATDADQVRRQIESHFPETSVLPTEGTLEATWEQCPGDEGTAVEFGLEREFMYSLATGKIDPFIGLVAALSELQPGELGMFQVLWRPVRHPWTESIRKSVTNADGKPLFVNEPELTSAAEKKVSRPLFAVVARIMVRSGRHTRVREIARNLASSLRPFINPQGNALIPLSNEGYPARRPRSGRAVPPVPSLGDDPECRRTDGLRSPAVKRRAISGSGAGRRPD